MRQIKEQECKILKHNKKEHMRLIENTYLKLSQLLQQLTRGQTRGSEKAKY